MTTNKKRTTTIAILTIYLVLFIFILIFYPLADTLEGYKRILLSPSILITDYIAVGGLSATVLNVITTTALNILIIKLLKVELNGSVFACLLTIAGFAFFGKNLYNALPIYLGVYLYTLASKTSLKDQVIVLLLSSGMSPVTSYIMLGAGFPLEIGIPLSILVGVLIGFLLPTFNVFSLKFHQGYNLYNTGFSMGVLSMIVTGVMASFGLIVTRNNLVDNNYHITLLISTAILSLVFIVLAFAEDKTVLRRYFKIFKKSGKLFTDFYNEFGPDVAMLNVGIMGLITLIVIQSVGITINGPVVGAILTILGFSAFGKHPLNALPVIIGAILAIEFTPIEWSNGSILAVLFVTGVAPIAGQFGLVVGIIIGFVHVMITPLALAFQGGFDLYNNGFAAGFVAAVFAPVLSTFLNKRDESDKWNYILPLKKKIE